ncbi:MAG TPA: hypothetical protein VEO54_01440 [Thermoanaerobaculia bacterium]|nr:hypothetical protein [Thermoanaerobaculia bacterium]
MRIRTGVASAVLLFAAITAGAQTPGFQSANGNTTTSDKVGIGVTTPATALHIFSSEIAQPRGLMIHQSNTGNNSAIIALRKSRGTFAVPTVVANGDSLGTIYSEAYDGTSYVRTGANIKFMAGANPLTGSVPSDLVFSTGTNGLGVERMRLDYNGLVTVGLTGDTGTRFKVHGDIHVTGNINAKYQDVAEWVPAAEEIGAATVVVLDPSAPNQVMPSTAAYATSVAGVVSDRPGLLLGEEGDAKVKVATTGRVRVRVDASRAPVAIGDLLVSSDKAGVAMKSEPVQISGRTFHQPGTIIGKALEPLAKGEGEILVLLSLQ